MTSTCQLSRNGSSKTLEEPFVKVEILRRDCPSRSPHFNPLRPCGRRHLTCISANNVMCISIHSARVGGDRFAGINLLRVIKFQSTPPVWAETPRLEPLPAIRIISIHSARVGGDQGGQSEGGMSFISIHSARVGGDSSTYRATTIVPHFNPLRPCGRRHNIWRS